MEDSNRVITDNKDLTPTMATGDSRVTAEDRLRADRDMATVTNNSQTWCMSATGEWAAAASAPVCWLDWRVVAAWIVCFKESNCTSRFHAFWRIHRILELDAVSWWGDSGNVKCPVSAHANMCLIS
ncbi:uncharacterized protein PV06_02282 [Exophiala oligosperma]|uniref:Uncharacterized protein n=1 Tax=Exophiala oligosperma TaxID=215243 RepID=A0A0D2DVJ2_9EURO|nr:uncharacterized protein PV06_02282 [Exophiala oligosperma]KIW46620.1 hypothetical protein PV06_02282 [Exophiala oligosperma]